MAIRSVFVGVNKHADPGIRDLTGATRDATALWAMFADSIPGLTAELIVDEVATEERIRSAIKDTLALSEPDDIAVISFSGHGSRDHRLVAHNTTLTSLAATSIGMSELADWFRTSRARAILFVLDCCFSGEAPARVLEDGAVPRSPENPLTAIAGQGRFLIAAANPEQSAYELPGTGHGILTKALIDVMSEAEGQVDITACMSSVMARVSAEAARIGVEQTPVLIGHVEGGLVFPALKRGNRFAAAFPDAAGIKVDGWIEQLGAFGIQTAIVDAWKTKYPDGLNTLQIRAVNDFRVLDGKSALVVAPTSSGKTFVGEMAAARSVSAGRKAVFLLPYRALVNEKYEQFEELYGPLGIRVVRCTGDYTDQTSAVVRGKYDLALLTYEMFLALAVGHRHLLGQLGLVVVDEGQFVTDPNRGINVELLLTLIVAARSRGVTPQLLVLSAVIGDINHFDEWLGCVCLQMTERPVPLIEGVIDRSGTLQYRDEAGVIHTTQFLPRHEVRQRKDKASAQDLIVPLVHQLVKAGEKVIVFRNVRGSAEGCAQYLANDLGLEPAHAALRALPNHDLSSTSGRLRACLQGGTAFHNTNLMREEKSIVERGFRDPQGGIAVLAATTTLAAGINTPASTVILAENEFIGDDGRPFTVAEYKNMAGRAGRVGYNEKGRSIIYAETPIEREQLFRKYVMGSPEPMSSSFSSGDLATWIVRLLAQVAKVPKQDVSVLLANTYGGFVAALKDPNWSKRTRADVDALLARMLSLGLVEAEGEYVRLTLLGRACGGSSLPFESSLRLVELLRSIGPQGLSPERTMAIIQILPEDVIGFTPIMKKGRSESVRIQQAAERYGDEAVRLMQRYVDDEFEYWKRCKRAAILWDWVEGVAIDEIEKRYSTNLYQGRVNHGDVRRFADTTRYHLRSAHQILAALFLNEGPSDEAMELLLRRLEFGLRAESLPLLELPLSLTRGQMLALSGNGLVTFQAARAAAKSLLVALIGEEAATGIAGDASEARKIA